MQTDLHFLADLLILTLMKIVMEHKMFFFVGHFMLFARSKNNHVELNKNKKEYYKAFCVRCKH